MPVARETLKHPLSIAVIQRLLEDVVALMDDRVRSEYPASWLVHGRGLVLRESPNVVERRLAGGANLRNIGGITAEMSKPASVRSRRRRGDPLARTRACMGLT